LLEKSVANLDVHWTDMVKMYGDKSVKFKGVVTRSQLAESLKTLKSVEVDSVDELVSKAIATAFSGAK
jgi:hypothetical protein